MKTYQLIGLKSHMHHVDIHQDGKSITKLVEFKGGTRSQGNLVPGTFKTDDPDIIKSLEESKNFNKKWKLIFDSNSPQTKSTSKAKNTEPEVNLNVDNADNDSKTFPEVTTGQEAKQILLKEIEGLKVSEVNSKKQILEVAHKNGISFPNLNA
ncbi:MAG: hypothetical protein VYB44_07095 [Bacteroidota bacterium]|nr:hypothetical protein [Bacteroidota bacterium]